MNDEDAAQVEKDYMHIERSQLESYKESLAAKTLLLILKLAQYPHTSINTGVAIHKS